MILVEIGQEIGGRRDPCLSRKVPNESLRKCGLASPEVAIEQEESGRLCDGVTEETSKVLHVVSGGNLEKDGWWKSLVVRMEGATGL